MGLVDIWIGSFKSVSEFDDYLKESYSDEDEVPISAFAVDQGEAFYDHDFIESNFAGNVPDFETLLGGHSYSGSYIDEANARFNSEQLTLGNTVILSFGDDFDAPKSVVGDTYQLDYLGRFTYDEKAKAFNIDESAHFALRVLNGVKVEFDGQLTDIIPITIYGLMIGKGPNPYMPSVDISSHAPEVADAQVRISVSEIRDFGANGLTKLGDAGFDDQKIQPSIGTQFSVGGVEFEWAAAHWVK